MAFWTDEAERQLLALHAHYVNSERYEAAIRLLDAVREAMRLLDSGPPPGRPYPGNWPEMRRAGLGWFKVHRYWFGHVAVDGRVVLTNILYDTADMPRRAAPAGPPKPFRLD